MNISTSKNKCYIKSELIRGKSRLVRMVSVPPVKFIAPESHANGALCFVSSYGGGMLGGDSVSIEIKVSENSGLVLLPQANSRAYTNTDGKLATQYMNVDVKSGGRFIFNADPLVLHEKSRYAQKTDVKIEEGAGAVLVDWFSIGRSENGEEFMFSEYSSSLEIYEAEMPILIDKQYLSPSNTKYSIAGAFASYTHMVNIFFVGESMGNADDLEKSGVLSSTADYIYSFTHNERYTILRVLGTTRQSLQKILGELYAIIGKDTLLGFDALERKM